MADPRQIFQWCSADVDFWNRFRPVSGMEIPHDFNVSLGSPQFLSTQQMVVGYGEWPHPIQWWSFYQRMVAWNRGSPKTTSFAAKTHDFPAFWIDLKIWYPKMWWLIVIFPIRIDILGILYFQTNPCFLVCTFGKVEKPLVILHI